MTEEEKKALEFLKDLKYLDITVTSYSFCNGRYYLSEEEKTNIDKVIKLIEKQRKEIEELRDTNKKLYEMGKQRAIQEILNENWVSKDKIKKILGIEEDMAEGPILSLLQTIVEENDRLEDIEDRKVQVAVDNIEKQRDKYWGDKIREILKNYLFTEGEGLKDFYQDIFELVREIDRNNEDLFTLGELEYAISHSEEFDFGGFNQETIKEAVKTIKKLDKIIQSFESGEMVMGALRE